MSFIELHYYLATSLEPFQCSRCFPSDVEYTYIRRVIGVELQHWVIPLVVQKSGFTTAQVGSSSYYFTGFQYFSYMSGGKHSSRFGAPGHQLCVAKDFGDTNHGGQLAPWLENWGPLKSNRNG